MKKIYFAFVLTITILLFNQVYALPNDEDNLADVISSSVQNIINSSLTEDTAQTTPGVFQKYCMYENDPSMDEETETCNYNSLDQCQEEANNKNEEIQSSIEYENNPDEQKSYRCDAKVTNYTKFEDGLYNQNGTYVYRGANPNNYIIFNCDVWRIISIDSQGLKIIKNEPLDLTNYNYKNANNNYLGAFDPKGYRDYKSNGAGGTYCDNETSGCNAWSSAYNPTGNFVNKIRSGTVLKDAAINIYLNGKYKNSLKQPDLINTATTWNIGPTGVYDDTSDIEQLQILESAYTWTGDIAFATKSEYMRANTNKSCLIDNELFSNHLMCKTTNYLYKNEYFWWLLSPTNNSTYFIETADTDGRSIGHRAFNNEGGVRPVLYLKNTINLTGSGTSSDPYIISETPENMCNNSDDPGYDPDNPGDDPDNPGDDPDNPGYDPDNPGDDPDNPGDDPDNPGDNPDDPGDNPDNPGDDPDNPGDNPDDPGDNPDDPGDNPDNPGDNPDDPGDNPDNPGDNSADSSNDQNGQNSEMNNNDFPLVVQVPKTSAMIPKKVLYTGISLIIISTTSLLLLFPIKI